MKGVTMSEKTTTVGEVNMGRWISQGWDLIFSDIGPILLLTLIYVVVIVVASSTVIGWFIVAGPLTVGFLYVLLGMRQGKPVAIGDIGVGFNLFAAAVLSNILISFFVSLGLTLCIIPGILVAALYLLAPAFIAAQKLDFWEAMEASRKRITPHLFEMSVFVLLLLLINLAGVLLCGIGIFISIPLSFAAVAVAYDDLVGVQKKDLAVNKEGGEVKSGGRRVKK